jgi:cytochrome c oxidase subunit 2
MVPILGVACFLAAMGTDSWPLFNHWFPQDISEHGRVIDGLFNFILALTGIIFIGTGITLFWFLWKFDGQRHTQPVKFIHGSHTLEIVWSIIPAATLLFIAFYQMNAWAENKVARPVILDAAGRRIPQPPLAEVRGRQFEWRIRYAGRDGVLHTEDDIHGVNDLHVPVDELVVLQITSEDVLHSFFLPNVRLKQDVIPGMVQFVWFKPLQQGEYDIVCAELCGWGHYKMKGRLTVDSPPRFRRWLEEQEAAQNWPSRPEDLEVASDE